MTSEKNCKTFTQWCALLQLLIFHHKIFVITTVIYVETKLPPFFRTILSNPVLYKMAAFWYRFQVNFILRFTWKWYSFNLVQGMEPNRRHYMSQCSTSLLTHICMARPRWIRIMQMIFFQFPDLNFSPNYLNQGHVPNAGRTDTAPALLPSTFSAPSYSGHLPLGYRPIDVHVLDTLGKISVNVMCHFQNYFRCRFP